MILVEGCSALLVFPPSITKTVVTTLSRVRFASFPTSLLHVGNTRSGIHSGPKFDKLIPLIEEVIVLCFSIPIIRDRISRFVGA
jgi:hypothetical protein